MNFLKKVRSAASQPPSDAAKRGIEEVKKAGNHIKEHAASQTENVRKIEN